MELNLEVKLKEWVDRTRSHPFGGDSTSTLYLSQNIDIYIYFFLDKGYIGWVVII